MKIKCKLVKKPLIDFPKEITFHTLGRYVLLNVSKDDEKVGIYINGGSRELIQLDEIQAFANGVAEEYAKHHYLTGHIIDVKW